MIDTCFCFFFSKFYF
uniref:Uncharacterized protein n=1 Tax=Rhizophora mucronata TaxID=61149 RepID=A0A2P2PD00_RHIMU